MCDQIFSTSYIVEIIPSLLCSLGTFVICKCRDLFPGCPNCSKGPSMCFHSSLCSFGYSNSGAYFEIRCVRPLVCHSFWRVLWIYKFFKWQVYTLEIIFSIFVKNIIAVLMRILPHWHNVSISMDILTILCIQIYFPLICFSFIISKCTSLYYLPPWLNFCLKYLRYDLIFG